MSYRLNGNSIDVPPVGADLIEQCEPEYIEMPGWQEWTVGARSGESLPQAAQDYLAKIEELCETPIDIISTGPDRAETIIRRHPFSD